MPEINDIKKYLTDFLKNELDIDKDCPIVHSSVCKVRTRSSDFFKDPQTIRNHRILFLKNVQRCDSLYDLYTGLLSLDQKLKDLIFQDVLTNQLGINHKLILLQKAYNFFILYTNGAAGTVVHRSQESEKVKLLAAYLVKQFFLNKIDVKYVAQELNKVIVPHGSNKKPDASILSYNKTFISLNDLEFLVKNSFALDKLQSHKEELSNNQDGVMLTTISPVRS